MNYTYATVIIAAADQVSAQEQYPEYFNAGFYEDIEGADPSIATNYCTSGPFDNTELQSIINDVTWPRKVYFGDTQAILTELNLKAVEQVQSAEQPVVQPE